jgi:hypothetical protein
MHVLIGTNLIERIVDGLQEVAAEIYRFYVSCSLRLACRVAVFVIAKLEKDFALR